jgi:hypothetical protein
MSLFALDGPKQFFYRQQHFIWLCFKKTNFIAPEGHASQSIFASSPQLA